MAVEDTFDQCRDNAADAASTNYNISICASKRLIALGGGAFAANTAMPVIETKVEISYQPETPSSLRYIPFRNWFLRMRFKANLSDRLSARKPRAHNIKPGLRY